jgi:uncharacterized protein (DUF2235 family)
VAVLPLLNFKQNTNVLELYSLVDKDADVKQKTWYNSGIGTYAHPSWKSWAYYKETIGHAIDMAIAWYSFFPATIGQILSTLLQEL